MNNAFKKWKQKIKNLNILKQFKKVNKTKLKWRLINTL